MLSFFYRKVEILGIFSFLIVIVEVITPENYRAIPDHPFAY